MDGHWERTYGLWFHSLERRDFVVRRSFIALDEGRGRMALVAFTPAKARSCVLLLHGTGNDALFGWEMWIEGLLHAGCAVLTVDIEGHGRGSSSVLDSRHFAQSAQAIAHWLSKEAWPLANLTICGYSLGGLYALVALNEGYLHARRLLLLAMPLKIEIGLGFLWEELKSVRDPVFWRHVRLYGWRASVPAFGSFRRGRFPLRLAEVSSGGYPRAIAALFAQERPLERAAACAVPTLLIYGSRDRLASPKEAAALARALPECEVVSVARGNHFLTPWQPETLARAIPWLSLGDIALT